MGTLVVAGQKARKSPGKHPETSRYHKVNHIPLVVAGVAGYSRRPGPPSLGRRSEPVRPLCHWAVCGDYRGIPGASSESTRRQAGRYGRLSFFMRVACFTVASAFSTTASIRARFSLKVSGASSPVRLVAPPVSSWRLSVRMPSMTA